ncbi:MAG: response regulator [Candidatus Riflebacteria bacterium]|nr:response regulator [Candidatus Riflebacteria bacterium]
MNDSDKVLNISSENNIRNILLNMNRFSITFAFIIATLVFLTREVVIIRGMINNDLKTQAGVIGKNSAAAVIFGDVTAAETILGSLRNVPHVITGRICGIKGELFAEFKSDQYACEILANHQAKVVPGVKITLQSICVTEPVTWKKETIGFVQIYYDTSPMVYRLVQTAIILIFLGMLVIFSASYLFSRQLTSLSDPILKLVETMRAITSDKDYSRRAPIAGPIEVATLAEKFNDLLQTTEEWNKEIVSHRENLEKLVEMRTSQWQTAVKNLEAELEERRRTELQLRKKTEELAAVSENLAQALKFEKRFLANVSHEIRTPLNAIIGFSNFVLQTSLSKKQHDYISKIQIAGNSLLEIINDILDSSKIEAGKLQMDNLSYNLDELIGNTVDIVTDKVHDKGLELFLNISPDIPCNLIGDPLRVRQILTNLLGNAVKFTEKGELELSIELAETVQERVKLSFSVRDTGIGMTPDQMNNLFMPFIQADGSTTRKFGGTGLGLSISKRLVEMMDGEITAESEIGKGTKFKFHIWQKINEKQLESGNKIPESLNNLHILLVYENSSFANNFIRMIQKFSFKLTSVSDVKDGEKEISTNRNNPFQLVFLENRNLSQESISFIMKMRQISDVSIKRPLIIPVLSFINHDDNIKLLEAGIDFVLKKPVTASMLFNSIVQTLLPIDRNNNEEIPSEWAKGKYRHSTRVLLVEDNDFNRQIAQELLECWNFVVETAINGMEAAEMVFRNQPDYYKAILMDIQMPELDGFESTKKIRSDPRFSNIPIIAMTANAFAEDRVKSIQAGMNDHVAKPIDPVLLKEKLHRYVPDFPRNIILKSENIESSAFPSIKGIDHNSALSRFNGSIKKYCKQLFDFYSRKESIISSLQREIDTLNFENIKFNAHSLKGLSGSLGMMHISESAGILEKSSSGSSSASDEIEKDLIVKWLSLKLLLESVFSEIEKYLEFIRKEALPQSTECQDIPVNALEAIEKLKRLSDLITKQDFKLFDEFEKIKQNYGKMLSNFKEFEMLQEKISQYSFEEAQENLSALIGKI